jgi:outer membrane protein W
MNKILFGVLLCSAVIFNAPSLQAYKNQKTAHPDAAQTEKASNGVILEARASYFYPTAKEFPVYYGNDVWLQGLDVWAAVDYFHKTGRTTGLHDKTSIRIVPITLGLKYFFPALGTKIQVNFYIASGMKYFFVHTHTDSSFLKKNVNKSGMGGVFEAGFTTTFVKHLVLDVFAAYSLKTLSAPSISKPVVETTSFNISNLNVGLGLGYKF